MFYIVLVTAILVTAIKVPLYIEPEMYSLFLSNIEKRRKINHFYRIEDSYRSLLGDALIKIKKLLFFTIIK